MVGTLLPDLFERFTRADTSRARNTDVTSHPGMTRFTVLLPMLRDHAERATAVME